MCGNMLHCTVMIDKHTDSSYNHSHKKSTKSFEKTLDIKHRIEQNSQLHSFTASQLHSFTAEGKLCPNKTIKHKQIYSHKKPQGTQNSKIKNVHGRTFLIAPRLNYKLTLTGGTYDKV